MLINILTFWLILQIFNVIGLPVAFGLLKNLPDRGYTFARPLGLLLSGYLLWLAGSFGLLGNNLGGTLIAMIAVAGLGIFWLQKQGADNPLQWLKAHLSYVLIVELVFFVGFVAWAIFKAYNPNIETAGGEKWMEIAFINSNLLSPGFPPTDPWLSGFGISYYYFGYVLMAMLTRLSGIVSTTAFNLFIPTIFALVLVAAFGITVNMITAWRGNLNETASISDIGPLISGLLGSFFVAIMGHWEGVLEVLHSRGLLPPAFWIWLDVRDLKIPPGGPGPWIPERFIWWWRGSRVLTDYNLAGQEQEVIDEFPFFSLMLGDVHPHVLALPFVLLIVVLALNLLLSLRESETSAGWLAGLSELVAGMGGRTAFGLYAVCVGALGFLNTWDLPIYLSVLGLAFLAWRGRANISSTVVAMGVFAVSAIALYFPFYLSFQSQAGGILPNLWNPTRLPQFILFFGPFLLISVVFLFTLSRRAKWPWAEQLWWTLPTAILGPVLLLLLLGAAFLIFPGGRSFIDGVLNDPNVQTALNGASQNDLLREIFQRRGSNPWAFVFVGAMVAWVIAHLWAGTERSREDELPSAGPVIKLSLILLLMGLLLPLSVEFVFLRDLFGTRMNTIFKFYYQAWVLLALASAFGVYYVAHALKGVGRIGWQVVVVGLVLAGLVYPILAGLNKTNNFQGEATLDGINWVAQQYPNDHAAILWLRENAPPNAIILEQPGDSYRYQSRVSALTGRPTLLGWDFHEYQWRGNRDENTVRKPDAETIYNTLDPAVALTLLDKYDINYVYVGPLERAVYNPAGLAKFEQLLDVVFQQGDVTIYQR